MKGSFIIIGAAMLLACGCRKEAAPPSIVARVDDTRITIAEFQERLTQQRTFEGSEAGRAERQKSDLLDDLIQTELLAKEARRRGYAEHPAVLRVAKQHMIAQYLRDEIEREIDVGTISEAEIEDYYHGHSDEFGIGQARLLQEVRPMIQQRLVTEHRKKRLAQLLTELRAMYPVEVDQQAFASVK